MAEKEGFEPPVPFLAQLISSQSHSATLPLLHTKVWEEIASWGTLQALTASQSLYAKHYLLWMVYKVREVG